MYGTCSDDEVEARASLPLAVLVLVVGVDGLGEVRAGDDLRLVGGVGGRDVLGVVLGDLRVLEQRLARVGALELVDLVVWCTPGWDRNS